MKNLNEYIKESILDDEEKVMGTMGDDIVSTQWVKDNYIIFGKKDFVIKNGILNAPDTGFDLKNQNLKHLTNGLFKFDEVKLFHCEKCEKLIDLEGGPKKIKNDFYCRYCSELKTLQGSPQEVGGNFDCRYCKNLESLKGSPREVGGFFDCRYNKKLTSLKGAPKEIGEFIAFPDSIENIKEEIKKNNIKVKEGYSEVGQIIQF